MNTRTILLIGCSLSGLVISSPVWAQAETAGQGQGEAIGIGEIIVTAQKRSERLQDVPIAVSTLGQDALDSAGVQGATDLRTQIPNLNFSRSVVNGPNFGIRGIGAKIVGPSADTGVGVHVNNAPLTTSRITDADFYDVERVEVLRGPQGTLYGRNATGGVFNTITAKPKDSFEASITGEYGNYDSKRLQGMVNIPLTESLAVRAAGMLLKRDGYSYNTYLSQDADDRDLWGGRITVSFKPSDSFRAFVLYEHFEENDRRMNGNTTRCTPDPGPASVGGVAVNNPIARGLLSQGCQNASIYNDAALGAPNTFGTVNGPVGLATGIITSNLNAGVRQNPNMRRFASPVSPQYHAVNNLIQLNMELDVAPDLTLSSLSSYDYDSFRTSQQPESAIPSGTFNTTSLTPGGVYNDPQLGPINFPASVRNVLRTSKQFSQEVRLQSSFSGPINFNVGGIYFWYDTVSNFVFPATGFSQRSEFLNQSGAGIYIDRSSFPDLTGHNYLISQTPYTLNSYAALGEVYWDVTDNLKITGGLRYTDDRKHQVDIATTLFAPGRGLPPGTDNRVKFREVTGRFNVAWQPDLSFTRDTLIYASYSRGYKGGGFNTQAGGAGTVPPSYAPEFVNAFEIGTKNTLAGGTVVFNATAFYYDYQNYQVAKLVGSSTATENIDARIKGIELETIVEPTRGLRFNANLGLLDTKIKSGSSLDELNLTQGNPDLTLVKNGNGTNCVANTSGVAGIIAGINAGVIPAAALLGLCSGSFASRGVVVSNGQFANLKGNQLPDAPKWTISVGAEYSTRLGSDWQATLRADYFRQGKSFSRVYNSSVDRLDGYENLNMTLTFDSDSMGLQVQGFVRNLTNEKAIISSIPTTSTFGLFSVAYLNEPRVYGLRLTKRF